MSRTSNWSRIVYLSMPHQGNQGKKKMLLGSITQVPDAMPVKATRSIDWSSVLLPLHHDFEDGSAPPPNPTLTPA